jgi:hypothetical protein
VFWDELTPTALHYTKRNRVNIWSFNHNEPTGPDLLHDRFQKSPGRIRVFYNVEAGGNIKTGVGIIFNKASIHWCYGRGVRCQLFIRLNTDDAEVFSRGGEKVSTGASDLDQLSGRTIKPNQIETCFRVQPGEAAFFRQIEILEVAIGFANPFCGGDSGVRAECQIGSAFADVIKAAGAAAH